MTATATPVRQSASPTSSAEQPLRDLRALKRAMATRAAQRAAEAARLAAERAEAEAAALRADRQRRDRALFEQAVGKVLPLAVPSRHSARPAVPSPLPLQRERDERQVMREALSDGFDVETLLLTDEHLSYRRAGMGPDVVRKLRQGHWALQAEIDLHGLRTDQAREALGRFVRESHHRGLRCVRVVHGKGLGSPGKTPVLKSRVHSWLIQKNEVMAFVQARPAEGGAGALVVLLRPSPRVHGPRSRTPG